MGALGCSEGPGPSSVVCAEAPSERAPEIANARTAHFPANRLFITHLFCPEIVTSPRECSVDEKATAMPMNRNRSAITLVFSMWKNSNFRGRWIEPGKLADLSQTWWFSATGATLRESPRIHRHHLCIQPLKSVHAFFLLHAEAPASITSRAQILLYRFADRHVLDLDLIAKVDGRFRRRSAVILLRQIPFEDRQRPLWL